MSLLEESNWLLMKELNKTILLEQSYEETKFICSKFQDESGAADIEVKNLLGEISRIREKDIDYD